MKDKEIKLIEKLIADKEFLTKFSERKSLEEQLGFLRANGFNFNEKEFKDFLKDLEEVYILNESLSEKDLERISGGKMQMKTKIAAATLVFGALGAGSVMGQASAIGQASISTPASSAPGVSCSDRNLAAAEPKTSKIDQSKPDFSKANQPEEIGEIYKKRLEEAKKNETTLAKFVQEIEAKREAFLNERIKLLQNSVGNKEKLDELKAKQKALAQFIQSEEFKKAQESVKSQQKTAPQTAKPTSQIESDEVFARKFDELENLIDRKQILERKIEELEEDLKSNSPDLDDETNEAIRESSKEELKKTRKELETVEKELNLREIKKSIADAKKLQEELVTNGDSEGAEEIEIQIKVLKEQLNRTQTTAEPRSGLTNLTNTCYLNTALQVLAHESTKVDGKTFREAILNLTDEQVEGTYVLSALRIFFRAYCQEERASTKAVSEGTMERVWKNLAIAEVAAPESNAQFDTTETLGNIIDKCLNECQDKSELNGLQRIIEQLYAFNYRESDDLDVTRHEGDSEEVIEKRKEKKIKRLNLTKLPDGRYVKPDKKRLVYPSMPLPEAKLDKDLKFNEIFDVNLVSSESLPKNIIIQFARKHYKQVATGEIQELKLKNSIEILPEITIHGRRYRLKAISIHSGGAAGGHYYAYVRDNVESETWWCYNDESVETTFKAGSTKIGNTVNLISNDEVKKNATNLVYEMVE